MKLLKLVANCINFVTQDEQAKSQENLGNLQSSPNYKAFINNAIPEINRAIQELCLLHKLPIKEVESDTMTITYDTPLYNQFTYDDGTTRYLPTDFLGINKVCWCDQYGNYTPIRAFLQNNRILFGKPFGRNYKGKVVLFYYPLIETFSCDVSNAESEDNVELSDYGITDVMCQTVIPYFVKANLWQEIEPELAQSVKSEGMQNLSLLPNADEWGFEQSEVILENDY